MPVDLVLPLKTWKRITDFTCEVLCWVQIHLPGNLSLISGFKGTLREPRKMLFVTQLITP
jgi:hypothetical protein